jgi:hypothetical protein
MNWTEVMRSDDAKTGLGSFAAADPEARRDWSESENCTNHPSCTGGKPYAVP